MVASTITHRHCISKYMLEKTIIITLIETAAKQNIQFNSWRDHTWSEQISSNFGVLQPLHSRHISQLWLGDWSLHSLTCQNLQHPLHPRNDPMSNTEVVSMLQRMPQDQLGREAPSSTITQASSPSHGSRSWEWTCRHSLPISKRHGQ